MFDESDIRLDQASLDFVVLQAGAGIEGANVVDGLLDGIRGASDGLGDFFVLLALHGSEVLVDYGNGILEDLRGAVGRLFCGVVSVFFSVLMVRELLLVMMQLEQKAFAQSATAHTRRV
jgi:hypothetical protein